jgi:two-component system sensor histidine kinase EvgS
MPVMDGYELTRRLRAWERAGDRVACSVIGCTANAQPEERQRCLEVGMDDCLFKPVGVEMLRQCLASREQLPDLQSEPAAAPELQGQIFDLALIDSLTGGDQHLTCMLFTQLYDSNTEDLRQFDEALVAGRWRELGRLVHRLKGAAPMVGAQLLVAAALAYEHGVADAMADAELQRLAYGVRTAVQQLQEAVFDWLSATTEL